jgi:hypothetical protein
MAWTRPFWRRGASAGQLLGVYASKDDFVQALVSRDAGLQYILSRIVTAICGVATVLVVYAAAMAGYRRRTTAIFAALAGGCELSARARFPLRHGGRPDDLVRDGRVGVRVAIDMVRFVT